MTIHPLHPHVALARSVALALAARNPGDPTTRVEDCSEVLPRMSQPPKVQINAMKWDAAWICDESVAVFAQIFSEAGSCFLLTSSFPSLVCRQAA